MECHLNAIHRDSSATGPSRGVNLLLARQKVKILRVYLQRGQTNTIIISESLGILTHLALHELNYDARRPLAMPEFTKVALEIVVTLHQHAPPLFFCQHRQRQRVRDT